MYVFMCLCVINCLYVYSIQDWWILALEGYFSHFRLKGIFVICEQG